MTKRFILNCFIVLLNTSLFSQINLPNNSSEESQINNWLIANVSNFNDSITESVISNPVKYFETLDSNNLKDLRLSNHKNITISLHQIFEEVDYNNTFIIACNIKSSSNLLRGLYLYYHDFNATIYINGEKITSRDENSFMYFDYHLKKGNNNVVIIANSYGNYEPAFKLSLIDKNFAQLKINIKKSTGTPYSNGYFSISDGDRMYGYKLNENGARKFWLKPGKYQISSNFNDMHGWSEKIKLSENQIKNTSIVMNMKSKISGKVFSMDGNSPQEDIQVNLINSETKETILTKFTNDKGEYYFNPPLGNWIVNIETKNKIHNKEIIINNINREIKNLNFKIYNQITGSWNNISTYDGLITNTIGQTIISKNGNLVMGTFSGLSIIDAFTVNNYNYFNDLPVGPIKGVFQDSKGVIWIGYTGKGLIKWKNGKIIKHFKKEDGLPSNIIYCISEDLNGNLLLGTASGLSVFDGKKFKTYNFADGIGDGNIFSIKVDGKNIWLGTTSGLSVFDGKKFKTFDHSNYVGTELGDKSILCIESDDVGNMWLGTNDGLLKFDGVRFHLFSTHNALTNRVVQDLLYDNNCLWIATNGGLVKMQNEKFQNIKNTNFKKNAITSINKSKDGVLIISTSGKGVFFYDPNSFITTSSSEGLITNESINDIKADNNGILWASGNGGLYKFENGIVSKHYNTKNSNLKSNNILKLSTINNTSLWMIGYRNIYRYINENIVDETKQFNIPPNTYLYDIDFDNNGTMWLATNKGLGMFKNDSLIIFSESDGLVKPTSTSKVTIGKNGEVLYSTYGSGFSVYKNGSFTNFDETNGLTLNLISDIAVDSENNYWIATDGTGLQKYDGNKFINYTIRDGLSSDETYSLFIDDFENIWVGTFGGGVCYFNGEIWNNFDARDGLLQNTIKAVYGINGNKFWFGGKNGLTTYNPSKQVPELSIKKIETTFNNYNSFEELVKKKEKILVGTKTNFFLKSTSFNTKSEKLKFLVKIFNADSLKTITINSNKFEFHPKNPGNYEFEFQTIDRDNNYSKPLKIKLSIYKPWYINPTTAVPFWGFLILLISLSIYSSNKYLNQRRYTAKIKEESRIRLEEKNKEIVDSINYAKRIQDAMMTSEAYRKSVIAKSFVFFKPKDVVSGDFYWVFKDKEENIFFTVADCTGHGVPGAFMSMIGTSLLNEIIVEKKIKNTNRILDELRKQIIKSLNHDDNDDQKDGMDISVCKLNFKKNLLEFSGAHNPLQVVRNGEIKTYKGDSQAVGLETVKLKPFTKHIVNLQKNDMIYIYSDGYQDQFGGEKGKKYMKSKFKKLLQKISKEEVKKQNELLELELSNWMKNEEQIDDICIMGVRI